ncbi:MAG: NAD(P)H-hydrate dehydratase [Chlamydiota bacterium]|nr:NAD(P)H-hydrate dehydratase [Chlamydiota bacterium]
MMKVVSSTQMSEIESKAYTDGCKEEDFMEAAGLGVANYVEHFVEANDLPKTVTLLCGKGNNGGDGYVAGYHLHKKGYQVIPYQIEPIEKCTPLCQKHYFRLVNDKVDVVTVQSAETITFPDHGVIIDALFGTGLESAPREPYATIIEKANMSDLPIIAIDIPSGLNGNTGEAEGKAIIATTTIFLGLPKKGFFFNEGWNHVGKLHYVNFGLPEKYTSAAKSNFKMFCHNNLHSMIPKMVANRHKYQAGYVVGLAGSPGMPGAANLSSSAALRSGAGIVKLLHPHGMEAELSSSMYELIKISYDHKDDTSVLEYLNSATATFIGPGLGLSDDMVSLLKKIIPQLTKPSVIDADALSIIAKHEVTLPKNAILTPHIGEMRRLLKTDKKGPVDEYFFQQCQDFAVKKGVTLVLKGGPSFVFHPDKVTTVNPYGDPGMATAGSGDVLTGLIASLLAQGMSLENAAISGVFIHSYAGEIAAHELSSYCMTATDIINYFPEVFLN